MVQAAGGWKYVESREEAVCVYGKERFISQTDYWVQSMVRLIGATVPMD